MGMEIAVLATPLKVSHFEPRTVVRAKKGKIKAAGEVRPLKGQILSCLRQVFVSELGLSCEFIHDLIDAVQGAMQA
jgi:hypothetical protein